MKVIGRKIVMDFGEHLVAIEIYPKKDKAPCGLRYELPSQRSALLFNIVEWDGGNGHIERKLGTSSGYQYGQEIGQLMPSGNPTVWMTQEEILRASEVEHLVAKEMSDEDEGC